MSDARVWVSLEAGALGEVCAVREGVSGAGAALCFEGVVRGTEDGRAIVGLSYEAYEPMTSGQLRALGESVVAERGLLGLSVEHSVGLVAAGAVSFRLRVWSVHRKEGIAGMDGFIGAMKREVALWKVAVFEGGSDGDGGGS